MPNAEARRTMPGPLEVVEIERSFLREVGSVFWFIANTFQETHGARAAAARPVPRSQLFPRERTGWCGFGAAGGTGLASFSD